MSEKNKPEIRFRGFEGEWNITKLGKVGSTFTGLSGKTKNDFGHGVAKYITYMNVYLNAVANLQMTDSIELDSKQTEVRRGDVFFTTSSETPEEVGMTCVLTEPVSNTYLNSFCFGYRPTLQFDLFFLAHLLRATRFRENVVLLAQGISRYNISKNKVMEIEVPYPKLVEQKRIGSLFSALDRLIDRQRRKLGKLQTFKQAMLEKMFPKEGSLVPEIRFRGFQGEWEIVKLEEIGDTFTGLSGKTKNDFGHGKARYITYMNVYLNAVVDLQMTDTIEIDQKQTEVREGDVFFTTSSETPDEVGMSCVLTRSVLNMYLNSFCFGYRPKMKFDLHFLACLFRASKFRKDVTLLAQGISRYNISKNKVIEIEISYPSASEQACLGSFFSNLDRLIVCHQHKLEKLQTLKQSLLQKMFV